MPVAQGLVRGLPRRAPSLALVIHSLALRSADFVFVRRVPARCVALACSIASVFAARTPQDPPADPRPSPSTAANAQDPPPKPVPRVPEVVVTESRDNDPDRFPGVPLDNAGGRTVIDPRSMQRSGAMNIQEALRRSPGVHISEETGSDSLPNIAMRGVTNGAEGSWRSINLGMYADGIPLAPAPYGGPGNSLFPFALERVWAVDVQRGGGGVRYGPNNVSGVVNFLTRPIPERATFVGRVRYDTFENESYYTAIGGTTGQLGLLLEAVYKNGETFRDNGDYTIQNYALKTSFAVSKDVRVLTQVETFDDDTNLSDGLPVAAFEADPKQSLSPQNRFTGNQDRANIKLEWDAGTDTLVELITYWYDGNRTFFLGSPLHYGTATPTFVQATPRPMRTVAVQPQVTHTYSIPGGTAELHVGARYLQEDIVRNVTRYLPNGTTQLRSEEQFDYYTGSAFFENAFHVGDLTVTPGCRFEYVAIDARNRLSGFAVERDFTEVLPSLTSSWRLQKEWSLFGGVQSTFAAPQAPQIEISGDPQDISAQYAWVYEIGSRTDGFDGLLGTELTLYHIEYKDRLVADPNQFDVFLNGGRSRHRGVELALDTDLRSIGLPGVTMWNATSYNESKFTNGDFDGNRFAGAPEWIVSWGGRYRHEATGLWIGFDGTYVDSAYSDALNTRDIPANGTAGLRPSYSIWNASLGWEHAFDDSNEVAVLVGGRNVFDEEYFEPRTARGIFPGAPASLVFQVEVTHRL